MAGCKPTFIRGKGCKAQIETYGLAEHYRRIFRGLTAWDGLPEGCPEGFPQDCIFFTGGIGCKRMRGIGPVLSGISPTTLTVYGTPYDWIPQPIGMAMNLSGEFFQPTNDPCIWMGDSMANMIEPFVEILDRTLKTLNQNIIGLTQPVMVKGLPGTELPAVVMKNDILDVSTVIPSTGAGFNAEILDLKAQDHTQNLISTADWCDARILEILMSSNGVEKASGITTLETVSGVQSIIQEYDGMLARCRDFADQVNDRFRMDLSVKPGKGMESLMAGPQSEAKPQEDAEDVSEE